MIHLIQNLTMMICLGHLLAEAEVAVVMVTEEEAAAAEAHQARLARHTLLVATAPALDVPTEDLVPVLAVVEEDRLAATHHSRALMMRTIPGISVNSSGVQESSTTTSRGTSRTSQKFTGIAHLSTLRWEHYREMRVSTVPSSKTEPSRAPQLIYRLTIL